MRSTLATSGALLCLAACTGGRQQRSEAQSARTPITDRDWVLVALGEKLARAGNSLRFGPAVATKMACADGDELERRYLEALPVVTTYDATDRALTLKGPGGPLARFHPR
jgi:hypothetical protein